MSVDNKVLATYSGIQVRNIGGATAQRVRVEIDGLDPDGKKRTISYWEPSAMAGSVSLDPGEVRTLFLLYIESGAIGPHLTHPSYTYFIFKPGRYDLLIRVLARDIPAREAKAVLEVS